MSRVVYTNSGLVYRLVSDVILERSIARRLCKQSLLAFIGEAENSVDACYGANDIA